MWPLFCEGLNLISALFLLPWLPLHPSLPPSLQALCCPSWQLATSTSDSAWGWDKLKHDWMELKQFLKGETVQLHQKKEMNTRWANITLKNCIHNTIVCQARIKDVFLFPFVLLLNGFPCSKKKKAAYTSCWNISGGFNGSNGGAAGAAEQWGVPGIKRKPDGCLDGTEFLHLNQTGNGITADYSRCSQLSNLSLHVYDSLVFDLLGEMCMCCSVCVCVCTWLGMWGVGR